MAFFRYLMNQIRRIFKLKTSDKEKVLNQILLLGGYGFSNTGDEAQCNETITMLSKRYPNIQIKVLSPNPNYTMSQHNCYTGNASRVSFYNMGYPNDSFSGRFGIGKKLGFLINAFWVLINAYFVRSDLPMFFINARKAQLLQDIYESKLVYFSGGGFLTGDTLSRLWDGIMVSKLAEILGTPVVMSGQTIGLWKNSFNKRFARWGFNKVKLITVRDDTESLKDLNSIGLCGDKYFATHDDALFCEKSSGRLIDDEKYMVINFHYWGMAGEQRKVCLEKIHNIIKEVLKDKCMNVIFISMLPNNRGCFFEYMKQFPDSRVKFYDYDYDFRKIRNVIANAEYCVTMKHHPIIFAMGENVPSISLAFSEYYMHKNLGALKQYGQERFCINLENENYLEEFRFLLNEIKNNKPQIITEIESRKNILAKRKEKFLDLVDSIIGE